MEADQSLAPQARRYTRSNDSPEGHLGGPPVGAGLHLINRTPNRTRISAPAGAGLYP